jgi:hypothetical protein
MDAQTAVAGAEIGENTALLLVVDNIDTMILITIQRSPTVKIRPVQTPVTKPIIPTMDAITTALQMAPPIGEMHDTLSQTIKVKSFSIWAPLPE